MESSREKHEAGGIFDVQTSGKKRYSLRKWFRGFIDGKDVIDLQPKFHARHPWMLAAIIAVIAVVGFLGVEKLFTHAEVQDLFPATCLGNWQNPGNASGKPETFSNANTLFSSSNSAAYDGSNSLIFCGGFVPANFTPKGNITSIGLTLEWQIGNAPASTTAPTPATSSTLETTSTDQNVSSTPTSTATSTSFLSASKILSYFISSARAQDDTGASASAPTPTPADNATTPAPAPDQTPTPSPAPVPASSPTPDATSTPAPVPTPAPSNDTTTVAATTSEGTDSTTVILGPPLIAPLTTPTTTSSSVPDASTTIATTTAPVVVPPPQPDENFLDVSYSLDGQTWVDLQKVSVTNWPHLTIAVPVNKWSDLKNLQIRVQGIPTTQDPLPPVLLDGMFVEVNYDIPPLLQPQNQDITSTSSQLIDTGQGATIEIPAATVVPFEPPPTIVSLTKSSDTVTAVVQYVGDFSPGNPLYLFMYPDGTTANRNGSDSAYTFAGQPQEGPSINALSIGQDAFDPTTKQAMVTIVEPDSPDDSHVTTGLMVPGTYDVDVSYFDGAVWNLIPAQQFTWP